jgi:hypothetical protein
MICFGFVYQLYPVGNSVPCSHTSSRRNSRLGRYGHHSCFPYTDGKETHSPYRLLKLLARDTFIILSYLLHNRTATRRRGVGHFPAFSHPGTHWLRFQPAIYTTIIYRSAVLLSTYYVVLVSFSFFAFFFFVSRLSLSKNELGGVCWFL